MKTKKLSPSSIENKLVVISGDRGEGRDNIGVDLKKELLWDYIKLCVESFKNSKTL